MTQDQGPEQGQKTAQSLLDGQLSASQLSAMFDGELPAAECELLSRRIDRDEKLRARWSRYALIGAAMRSEPVATARSGFASRVSAALDAELGIASSPAVRVSRAAKVKASSGRTVWNTALAASMVAAVAGVSIALLRYSAPTGNTASVARADLMPATAPASAAVTAAVVPVALRTKAAADSNGEPRSYVTPINQTGLSGAGIGLQTQLADFMVAHSQYSRPLVRPNLLSALVASEELPEGSVSLGHAGQTDAMAVAGAATH